MIGVEVREEVHVRWLRAPREPVDNEGRALDALERRHDAGSAPTTAAAPAALPASATPTASATMATVGLGSGGRRNGGLVRGTRSSRSLHQGLQSVTRRRWWWWRRWRLGPTGPHRAGGLHEHSETVGIGSSHHMTRRACSGNCL